MKRNFLYGSVIKLTREDTPETIEKNFLQMKDSGFDTVVVWPAAFWWEEKKEGYPFNTGRTVLEIADKIGLGVIMELAGYLVNNRRELVPEKLDWIYHSTACRAAIKAGDKTSEYELEKFVEKLLNDPDIRYCPHGRPVLIEMSKYEIEKNFGRV